MAQNVKGMFNDHPGLRQNPNAGFDEFRHQLFLTMARKLADKDGRFSIPVEDVDANGQYTMTMEADNVNRVFKFHVRKKQ